MSWIAQTRDVSKEEVVHTYNKLKQLKYPVKAISNAMPRVKKLNNFSAIIKQKLQAMLDSNLNAYRQVRGDGNCFFRAFAFTYITNVNSNKYSQIFAHMGQVSLQTCKLQSIPKDFRPFYKDHLLKAIILQYWEKDYEFFYKNNGRDFRRGLARMLTEYPFFDFIIILYFRALCLSIFKDKKSEYKQFLNGTEEIDISTYGAESESLVIGLISKFLLTTIYIYEVRKDEIVPYEYSNLRGSTKLKNDVHLLFYDNHYDLLEVNPNCLSEYNDEKMEEEEYYSDISLHYIMGICIECQKGVQISQETGLCLVCYNKSMQNLQKFKKDKLIDAICASCNRRSRKVSQQLMICQDCLQSMQYSREKNQIYGINDSQNQKNRMQQVKTRKCKNCGVFRQIDDFKNGICFECLFESRESNDKPTVNSKMQQSKIKTSKIYSTNVQQIGESFSISIPSIQGKLQSKISQDKKQLEQHEQKHLHSITKAQIFSKGQLVHCEHCANKTPSMNRNQKEQETSYQSGSIIKQNIKAASIIQQRSTIRQNNEQKKPCGICNKYDGFYPLVDGVCRKCIGTKKY